MHDDDFGCIVPIFIAVCVFVLFLRTGFQPPGPGSWGRYKTAFVVATVGITYLAYRARAWAIAGIGSAVLLIVYRLHH